MHRAKPTGGGYPLVTCPLTAPYCARCREPLLYWLSPKSIKILIDMRKNMGKLAVVQVCTISATFGCLQTQNNLLNQLIMVNEFGQVGDKHVKAYNVCARGEKISQNR
jgi:hypothetical protein